MTTSGLTAIASWDVGLLRNAVGTLRAVDERLMTWRGRMEAVGRSLGSTECWSGPAAGAASGSLLRVSTVVTEVTAAMAQALADADRMVLAAGTAAELAGEALATASAVPVELDERGAPGPLPVVPLGAATDPAVALQQQYESIAEQAAAAGRAAETAAEALRSADAAALAAREAVAALAGVGVVGGRVPVDFLDLVAGIGLGGITVPGAPPPDPAGAAAWWARLSEEQRLDWIDTDPGLIGILDGVPAWARDRANRILLDRALHDHDLQTFAVAQATRHEIEAREAAGEHVQLYEFAPEHELVALAYGDLDTADDVAVVIPGVGNDPYEDLDNMSGDALAVGAAAVAAAPTGTRVASVAWLGYRPPPTLDEGLSSAEAETGGAALDRTLDGIAATRADDPARVTVVAHSYGTVVADFAADRPGVLAADAVVFNGSPGIHNDRAGMEVDEVYEASGGLDPITWFEIHGGQTWDPDTGLDAVHLPTEADMDHFDYYDPTRPTLAAMGEVVAGTDDG